MDPLAIFSLSLAILNILLNTISSVIDRAEEIKNLEDRFNKYLEILENCRMSLEVWDIRWEQDRPSALFGRSGWSEIQKRRDRIHALLENVLGHLDLKPVLAPKKKVSFLKKIGRTFFWKPRTPDDGSSQISSLLSTTPTASTMSVAVSTAAEPLSISSIEAWQVYVRQENPGKTLATDPSTLPGKPDVTVLKRIIGILYANRQLDRKIDDLQKAIDRLHAASRHFYYKQGHGRLGQEPGEEEVAESLELDRLQKIAGELYKSYLNQKEQYQWTLELRLPQGLDGGKSVVKKTAGEGTLYFTVNHQPASDLLSAELTVCYLEGAERPDTPGDSLGLAMKQMLSESSLIAEFQGSASLELSQAGSPTIRTKSLRFLLIKSRGSEQLQKIFSLERARVAYGCALWMILLWKTDWFANLCSCGFRGAEYDNPQRLSMASIVNENEDHDAERQEYSFRSLSRGNEHPCPRRYSHANKLYLLGILLAELYLSEAIDLELVNGRLKPSNPQQFESNLDIEKRMRQYKDLDDVRGAVKFCFTNAEEKKWTRSQKWIKKSQLNSLIENVLVPTQTYFFIVKTHFRNNPWASRFPDEYKKLADETLNEEDEHFTLAKE